MWGHKTYVFRKMFTKLKSVLWPKKKVWEKPVWSPLLIWPIPFATSCRLTDRTALGRMTSSAQAVKSAVVDQYIFQPQWEPILTSRVSVRYVRQRYNTTRSVAGKFWQKDPRRECSKTIFNMNYKTCGSRN
jgi:hypothetical protein